MVLLLKRGEKCRDIDWMGHKKEAGKKIFDRSASLSSTTGNGAVPNGGNRKKPDPFHRAQSKNLICLLLPII